jgi:predicted nucleic acid-binding protein
LIYADSSAIVKRYYMERGSDQLKLRWATIDRIFTSRVAYAEIHAALARKARDGELSRDSFHTAAAAFELEWLAYDHILVDEATLKDVRSLVRRHSLRGFDAIHLSAALWLRAELGRSIEFWASDQRLEAAAKRERLAVVNPEAVNSV